MKRTEQTHEIQNLMYLNEKQIKFVDQRSAENRSNLKPRSYNHKGKKPKTLQPNYFRFTLLIYFKNRMHDPDYRGNWIPSIDFYHSVEGNYIDEWQGLKKLQSRVKHNYQNLYATATIFMSIDKAPNKKSSSHNYPVNIWVNGQERFVCGGQKLIKCEFKTEGKNNFVNLESQKLQNDIIKFAGN